MPRVGLLSVIRAFPGHYETISYLSVQQSKLSLRGAVDDPDVTVARGRKKKTKKKTKKQIRIESSCSVVKCLSVTDLSINGVPALSH